VDGQSHALVFTLDARCIRAMRQWRFERREVLAVGEVGENKSDGGANQDVVPVICKLKALKR